MIPAHTGAASGTLIILSTLQIIAFEIRGTQIGAAIQTDRLVDVILVHVLRAALDQNESKTLDGLAL